MSLRGALGFAEAVSPYREIASLRQAQDRRRDPEKTSGQASKSPPRNDMPEQLRNLWLKTFSSDLQTHLTHLYALAGSVTLRNTAISDRL